MTNPLRGVTFPGLPGEFQIPQNAEDVGARPGTWMPSAADVGALPAAFSGVVSDAWVSNKTYYAGDYCIHNNTLWRCLVQNTGVTPAEGTYWTEVSVADEIKALSYANSTFQTGYGDFQIQKNKNSVSVYGALNNLPTVNTVGLGTAATLKPNTHYAIITAFDAASPYGPIGSVWINSSGIVTVYKPPNTTSVYVYGMYTI